MITWWKQLKHADTPTRVHRHRPYRPSGRNTHNQHLWRISLKAFQKVLIYFANKQTNNQTDKRQYHTTSSAEAINPQSDSIRRNRVVSRMSVPLTSASSVSCSCWFMYSFLTLTNSAGPANFSIKPLSFPLLKQHVTICRGSLPLHMCYLHAISKIRALWVLFSVALLGLIKLPNGSVTADWIIGESLRQQSVFF